MLQNKTQSSAIRNKAILQDSGDLQICTMKKDLKNINNPNFNFIVSQKIVPPEKSFTSSTHQEIRSPFLNKTLPNKTVSSIKLTPPKTQPVSTKLIPPKPLPAPASQNQEKNSENLQKKEKSFFDFFSFSKKDPLTETIKKDLSNSPLPTLEVKNNLALNKISPIENDKEKIELKKEAILPVKIEESQPIAIKENPPLKEKEIIVSNKTEDSKKTLALTKKEASTFNENRILLKSETHSKEEAIQNDKTSDLQLYTMKKDLKNITNPDFNVNVSQKIVPPEKSFTSSTHQETKIPLPNKTLPIKTTPSTNPIPPKTYSESINLQKSTPVKKEIFPIQKEQEKSILQIEATSKNEEGTFSAITNLAQKELAILNAQLLEKRNYLEFAKKEEQSSQEIKRLLENELVAKKETIQTTELQLKEVLSKKHELDETLKKELTEIRDKENKIAIAQKELGSLNTQIEEKKKSLDLTKKEDQSFNEKINSLKNEFALKEKELTDKKNNIQNAEAQLRELLNKKREMDSTFIREELLIKENEEKLSTTQKELAELNSKLEEVKNLTDFKEINSLKSELVLKEKELTDKKNNIQNADIQLRELLNKKQDLEAYIIKEEARINEEREYFKNLSPKRELSPEKLTLPINQMNKKYMNEPTKQENDSPIQNTFMHSMKDDLSKFNPNSKISGISQQRPLPETTPFKSTEKRYFPEETNPFFKKEIPASSLSNAPREEVLSQSKNNSQAKRLTFAIALSLIILIIAGAGGYYFWMTRTKDESAMTIPIDTTIPEQPQVPVTTVFLTGKANYMTIDSDLESIDSSILKKTIADYTDKVFQTNPASLIEFIPTDKNNNPLTFQFFAEKLGLTLSPTILSQLNPDFSLYLYISASEKSNVGLAISTNNNESIKTTLQENESSLIQDLSPLYPDTSAPSGITFNEGAYNGLPLRYANITTSDDLAIDYAITNNQLIIGTNKTIFYSIIDYQLNNSLLLN